jgi:hypothetical protein
MPAQPTHSPWDFSEAVQLLNDLPGRKDPPQRNAAKNTSQSSVATTPQRQINGLGDFSKIYEYLGIKNEPPQPLAPSPFKEASNSDLDVPDPNRPPPLGPAVKDDAYASDGAVYTKKNVRFNDDTDVYEATDALDSPTSEDVLGPNSPSKTKKSKREKKAALKEKKKAINVAKIAGKTGKKEAKAALRLKSASDIDSEADIRKLKKPTPARKASVHSQLPVTPKVEETPQNQYNFRSKVSTSSTSTPSVPIPIPSTPTGNSNKSSKKKAAQASSASSSPAKSLPQVNLLGNHLVPGPITPKSKKAENKAPVTPQAEDQLEQNNDFFNSLQFPSPSLQPSASISMSPKQAKRQVLRPFSLHNLLEQTIAANQSKAMAKKDRLAKSNEEKGKPEKTLGRDHSISLQSLSSVSPMVKSQSQLLPSLSYQDWRTLRPHQVIVKSVSRARNNNFFSGAPTFTIWPKEDRDLQLFFRLVRDFGEDKKSLAQPVHLANHTSAPNGIHVFVDFSNIWIGFMEYLRYLPKPPGLRIPHQNLSFDSLVLLLERRRPVGKRVLAGSLPLLPAMELAKAIGYETNILDKVYKARELSEKQKRYLVANTLRRGNYVPGSSVGGHGGIVNNGNTSSGTETCDPTAVALFSNTTSAVIGTPVRPQYSAPQTVQMSPEKWVEQGVDEILHLKILESIVDTDEPSTMIVATGDAAKAEYSEGFMKMIVRALKKGWKVELVAWSKSISMDYRRAEFTNLWVGNFRIIELDQYAEFLLDT